MVWHFIGEIRQIAAPVNGGKAGCWRTVNEFRRWVQGSMALDWRKTAGTSEPSAALTLALLHGGYGGMNRQDAKNAKRWGKKHNAETQRHRATEQQRDEEEVQS